MAKIGVGIKIDAEKIEKARMHKGEKGTYVDMTAFIDLDELDQYGNSGMVTQDVSKEERQAGTKGPILGNTRVFWKDERQAPQQGQQSQGGGQGEPAPQDDFDSDSSIPF